MIREAVEYQPAETDQWTMDGLSLLTAMIGSEVFGTATRGQADAFFGAVGRRIASLLQVADISDGDALMARIAQLHDYDVPAILALPVDAAHPPFAAWVAEQLA